MPFESIDAAVLWNDGTAFFFKDDQYAKFDIATKRVMEGSPKLLTDADTWGDLTFDKVDAADGLPDYAGTARTIRGWLPLDQLI